jgi:prepilin-type N-terminal cleavage/methylation domain-containing protein
MTHRGITFIEMLVSISVVAVIMIAASQSVLFFYRTNRVALEESYQIRSAQRGIATLVRDLREATYADTGAYPLASIASSSITFYSDIDKSSPIEKIEYKLSGQKLTRTITQSTGVPPTYTGAVSTSTVSEYVRNFGDNVSVFRYYDATGAEITDPNDIAQVVSLSISIVVDITPIHAPGEFTLRSGATIRNLRPQ